MTDWAPPPPPPPPAAGGAPLYAQQPEAPRRRTGRIAVGAVAAVAVIGAGAFALAAGGGEAGAKSPQAAVDAFFDAVGDQDVLGVLDTVAPGERESIADGAKDLVGQLKRLGVLSDGADLENVSGIDLGFDDMEYDVVEVGEHVATVEVVGGTVTGSYDLSKLPLGDVLLDGAFDGEQPSGSGEQSQPIEPGLKLTTVERDGDWYVSPWYTLAEAMRADADLDPPAFGAGIAAQGAESPEQAVRNLVDAMLNLDVKRIIALTPPDEMAVLHDYGPLFVPDAEAAFADLDVVGNVDKLELTADEDGDEATVSVDAFAVTVSVEGESASVAFDGECAVVTLPDQAEQRRCVADAATGEQQQLLEDLGLTDLFSGDTNPGLRVVRVDGAWYVSPTRTMLGLFIDTMKGLKDDSLSTLVDRLKDGGLEELIGMTTGS